MIRRFATVALVSLAFAPQLAARELVGWQVLDRPEYRIHFEQGGGTDAAKIDGFMTAAIADLTSHFSRFDANLILNNIHACDIFLYAAPNDRASEGMATLLTNSLLVDGVYKTVAEIHLLTPSSHSPDARTGVGEPMDDAYIRKTLVHEYSSIWLERISYDFGSWGIYNAPSWFVQGYQEYLGLTQSSDHSRRVTLDKYRQLIKDDPSRVDLSFGIEVRNPYYDGAILLSFMHDHYGATAVQSIVSSSRTSFVAAIKDQVGTLNDFAAAWERWLQELNALPAQERY